MRVYLIECRAPDPASGRYWAWWQIIPQRGLAATVQRMQAGMLREGARVADLEWRCEERHG